MRELLLPIKMKLQLTRWRVPAAKIGTETTPRSYKLLYSRKKFGAVKLGNSQLTLTLVEKVSLVPTTLLRADINSIGLQAFGCGASSGQILNSNNDWNSVNLDWLSEVVLSGIGDSQDGVTGSDSKPNVSPNGKEMGPGFIKAVHDKAGDLIEFIPPPSTDGSSVSNAGSNDSHEVPTQRCRWQFCKGCCSDIGSKEGNSIKPNTAGGIPVPLGY